MDKINDTIIKIVNMDEINKPQRLIAKTGDTKGRDLYVQLVNKNEKGLNTEDARLTLAYKTPSGIINEIPFVPVNVEEGLYGITYDAGLTHEAGVVTATIRLKTYDTTTETPNFEIYVEGSPLEGIHFSEVDGLTFKKVMDKVDDIELRANLIEEDILKIDVQLQDMNTRIVYVEEDDGLDERVYNNENDIQLLEREIERIDTELADLRYEVDNIEVVEGGGGDGGGTGELDTGWRVWIPKGVKLIRHEFEIYVRRVGNVVEMQGNIKSVVGAVRKASFSIEYRDYFGKYRMLPDMFKLVGMGGQIMEFNEGGIMLNNTSSFMMAEDRFRGETSGDGGNISIRYLIDKPFTDEYMDLPLADFT